MLAKNKKICIINNASLKDQENLLKNLIWRDG